MSVYLCIYLWSGQETKKKKFFLSFLYLRVYLSVCLCLPALCILFGCTTSCVYFVPSCFYCLLSCCLLGYTIAHIHLSGKGSKLSVEAFSIHLFIFIFYSFAPYFLVLYLCLSLDNLYVFYLCCMYNRTVCLGFNFNIEHN